MKSYLWRFLAALACAEASVAYSQETDLVQHVTGNEAAALLIQAGRFEDAKRVLAYQLDLDSNDYEAVFLLGMIAAAEQDYDTAIANFRRILAAEPERERVRLELARAFFLDGDYENAERNFRFARAGELPDEAKANIDQYLGAILRLKRWSYDVGLSLAQDTNVNGATNVHQVDIYGLPFTLSDNARQKSGIGVALDVGGEWSPLIAGNLKGKLGGRIHRIEYGGADFDDMTVAAYAGPEILRPRWQIDTFVTGFRRWYGNAPYNQGAGGRAAATYAPFPNLLLSMALDAQSITYHSVTDQNGALLSGNLAVTVVASPSSSMRLSAGLGMQTARIDAYANTLHWVAFDYYRDLPLGFSANLEPAFSWTHYNAPLPAFGKTRSDKIWAMRVDLLNRRIEYAGFAPRLSLIYVSQASSIALYRYSRIQFQMGLTRRF